MDRTDSRTVLFASELGGGFGHVARLLPVARALAAHGYRPVFAVPNPVEVHPLLSSRSFLCLQAPRIEQQREIARVQAPLAESFADILRLAGFADEHVLLPTLGCWQALLDFVAPALIVCEYSPFLCLAALGSPTVVLGNGFTLPPPDLPEFPALSNRPVKVDSSEILTVIARVQRQRKRPIPASVPGILKGSHHFVCALAELDPYAQRRHIPPCGPPVLPEADPGVQTSSDVFAYVAGESAAGSRVACALVESGLVGFLYARNPSSELASTLRGSAIELLSEPADIASMLCQCRVVVHHGGIGLAEESLASGRPQVVVPLYKEQLLTGSRMSSMGLGLMLPSRAPPATMAAQIRMFANDPRRFDAASRAAQLVHTRYGTGSAGALVDTCLSLLQGRP
jgi:rhamnosyltransferase subunit B